MAPALHPCCLVVEDQTLIAMALEATMEDAGIPVAGLFASCADALAWTEDNTPSIAVLDYKLKDGPCTDLAKVLLARGVPVIIYSGLPQGHDTAPELRGVIWLEKPVPRGDLLHVIQTHAPALCRRPVISAA